MSSVKRVRLQSVVSEDMAKRVSIYADRMGVSVSALCAMLIGQGIMNFDKTYEYLENTMQTVIKNEDREKPSE